MNLGLDGKVALVTGASAGLGLAAATALSQEGASVAINSRSLDNLMRAAEKIKAESGKEPLVIPGDLGSENVAEEIVDKAVSKLGAIDILVSNAGGPPAGTFLTLSKESWKKSADLTLHSAINLTRAVVPGMISRKWGRIIYITSVSVKQPIDGLIISNALRAGLTGFAKSISNELASSGITVNTVCPGYTNTDRLKQLAKNEVDATGKSTEEVYRKWTGMIPAGRVGRPEELAYLIAFLSSEKAAFITGTSIPVDGGFVKGLL